MSARLMHYGLAVLNMHRQLIPHVQLKWRVRELDAYADRDVYAETVRALGYDPLGHDPQTPTMARRR